MQQNANKILLLFTFGSVNKLGGRKKTLRIFIKFIKIFKNLAFITSESNLSFLSLKATKYRGWKRREKQWQQIIWISLFPNI